MRNIVKRFAGTLALVIVAGCATQSTPIPPYLAQALSQRGVNTVASLSYQDEHGRLISENEFAVQYEQIKRFDMTSRMRRNSLPDVIVRLRPKTTSAYQETAQRVSASDAVADFQTCSIPEYPKDDLRARHTGTVELNFLIGADGQVKKSEIKTSSGYPGLDQAALAALARCRFRPGTLEGVPVEKWSPVKYVWSIS